MKASYSNILFLAILMSIISVSNQGLAAVKVSLSGSRSESNAGYQKIQSGAASAGLSMDLGEYFMVGYTHRQELSSTVGYQQLEGTNTFVYSKTLSHVTSNAVDLTLILYGGDIVTPFVFAGLAVKHYMIDTTLDGQEPQHVSMPHYGPQGGAGLSIRLNQKFSFKLTYTLTDGIKQLPGESAEQTIDTYTQMGITYAL
jgi:hypothetical protein